MERGPHDVGPIAADRLEAVRLAFDAQVRRFEEAKADLRQIVDEIQTGRSQREILHTSAFARLQARLDSMPVIEQAKGVLMAERRWGPDTAFDLLPRAPHRPTTKLSVLPAHIFDHIPP